MAAEVSPASSGRSKDAPADPEMDEGGSVGGRALVRDEGGDPAGSSHFSLAGQHLFALCARPVGGSMAEEGGAGGGHDRPLRRRFRHGVGARAEAERFLAEL